MTYSIVARDPVTGDIGVAVQSHYFGVGRVVTWGLAGVGVVATQSIVEVSYGPKGLALMEQGLSARAALDQLLALDEGSARRQVSMMTATGSVATHTGTACIAAAGHQLGDQVSVQANLVESAELWPAMIDAFSTATGDLAQRMLAALVAAEACGGDIRGRQSAAMLIVRGQATGQLAKDRILDVRVDDAADPLGELARLIANVQALGGLVALLEAPGLLSGEFTATPHEVDSALIELANAQTVLGDANREPTVWRGLLLARAGRDAEAIESFRSATEVDRRVSVLVQRLADAGMWSRPQADLDVIIAQTDAP